MDDSREESRTVPIREHLRGLPRVRASAHFKAAVLRRLRERETPPPAVPRWRWTAVAAAVLLLVAVIGIREWDHARERAAALARIEALRTEQQALEAELESLRRLRAEARPVVYLGSTGDVDLVLDLRRVRAASLPTHAKTRQDI